MYDLSSPEFITWQSWATAEVGQLIRTAESTAPHTPDQATLDFQPKGQVAQGDRTQLFTILVCILALQSCHKSSHGLYVQEKIYTDHGPLILQLGGQDENQRIWINLTKALPPGSEEDSSTTGTAEHVTDHKEELVCVLWISPRGVGQFPKMWGDKAYFGRRFNHHCEWREGADHQVGTKMRFRHSKELLGIGEERRWSRKIATGLDDAAILVLESEQSWYMIYDLPSSQSVYQAKAGLFLETLTRSHSYDSSPR